MSASQWAYKLSNKRNHEGQMVASLVAFDAVASATRSITELQATSVKFAPPAIVKDHLQFPGDNARYLTDIGVCMYTVDIYLADMYGLRHRHLWAAGYGLPLFFFPRNEEGTVQTSEPSQPDI